MEDNSLPADGTALVRISGQATQNNSVPADVLVRSVDGLQKLIYLLAYDQENKTSNQRFRISGNLQEQYRLMCQVPKAGSYAIPISLEPDQDLFRQSPGADMMDKLLEFFECLGEGSFEKLKSLFADTRHLTRALNDARKFLPKTTDTWSFGFQRRINQREITLGKEAAGFIDAYLSVSPEESQMTITGELLKIAFDDHKLYLRYPPTNQMIECNYSEEMEDALYEYRRDYIHVTGEFLLDFNGNPTKISSVRKIEMLDLSGITISELSYQGKKFIFMKPIHVVPELEAEEKQLLTLDMPQFGISAFARSRDELITEVSAQLNHIWIEYASCDNSLLTPEAAALKAAILSAVEVKAAA